MLKLNSIELSGFKSIDSEGQKIKFGDVTVFIGANGAGKSNLVSFFQMINYMTTGALLTYLNEHGSASSLLHFGPKKTQALRAELCFSDNEVKDSYRFSLSHAAGDIFLFTNEEIGYHRTGFPREKKITLGIGHKESLLRKTLDEHDGIRRVIYALLRKCLVFQFHDTSSKARIRGGCGISDDNFLYDDAGNLASILYAMANNNETIKYYERIVSRIKAVFPQFHDFVLEPSKLNPKLIELKWKSKEQKYIFAPHQISDGSLRFMALTTLLLQPTDWLPSVIIIDEPELGLHPTAISDLAGMVKTASKYAQIILATQSPRLLDEFSPEQIVVVEYEEANRHSIFKRLKEDDLKEWLERYTMSELWDKNVLGGTP